jgi:hypothetical protein
MANEKDEKVRVDVEERRRRTEDTQHEDDDVFQGEELEERIAPAKAPVLDTGIL